MTRAYGWLRAYWRVIALLAAFVYAMAFFETRLGAIESHLSDIEHLSRAAVCASDNPGVLGRDGCRAFNRR